MLKQRLKRVAIENSSRKFLSDIYVLISGKKQFFLKPKTLLKRLNLILTIKQVCFLKLGTFVNF